MGPDLGRKTVTCACGAEVGMTLRLGPLTFTHGDAHVDVDVTADEHTCPLDDASTQGTEVIR